jgi:hypothetical protein
MCVFIQMIWGSLWRLRVNQNLHLSSIYLKQNDFNRNKLFSFLTQFIISENSHRDKTPDKVIENFRNTSKVICNLFKLTLKKLALGFKLTSDNENIFL